MRGILNKLTPEKFKKLSNDLLDLQLDSRKILNGVIILIFDKALDEPKYSSMYAQLCKQVCKQLCSIKQKETGNTENETCCVFRLLLLNKCKQEFDNRSQATEAFEIYGPNMSPEEEERRQIAKLKMLGNIKVISNSLTYNT